MKAATCRACGMRLSPAARFCFVCKAPDPILPPRENVKPVRWALGAGLGFLLAGMACVGLWLARG